ELPDGIFGKRVCGEGAGAGRFQRFQLFNGTADTLVAAVRRQGRQFPKEPLHRLPLSRSRHGVVTDVGEPAGLQVARHDRHDLSPGLWTYPAVDSVHGNEIELGQRCAATFRELLEAALQKFYVGEAGGTGNRARLQYVQGVEVDGNEPAARVAGG